MSLIDVLLGRQLATEEEKAEYRRPYLTAGEGRRPTLSWPRQLPLDGEPADVVNVVRNYSEWLAQSQVPKLYFHSEPGALDSGKAREFCRSWPNQREVAINGIHFVQEDSEEDDPSQPIGDDEAGSDGNAVEKGVDHQAHKNGVGSVGVNESVAMGFLAEMKVGSDRMFEEVNDEVSE